MIVLGIDPGLQGGLALLTDFSVFWVLPMPLQHTPHGDIADSKALLTILTKNKPDLVVVERQQAYPKDRKKGIFTLGRGYGQIEAAINISLLPAIYPLPTEWKKETLKGTKMDKQACIGWVQSRFPEIDICIKGKPHDGLADAIAIAYYGLHNHV